MKNYHAYLLIILLFSNFGFAHEDWAPLEYSRTKQMNRLLPDRVILTWEDDPSSTQSVTWRTDISTKRASPIWRSQIQTEGLSNQKGLRHKPPISKAILMKQITIVLRSESCCLIRYTPTGLEMVSTGPSTITSRLRVIGPSLSVLSTSRDAQNEVRTHWSRVFREAFGMHPELPSLSMRAILLTITIGIRSGGTGTKAPIGSMAPFQ